MSEKGLKQSKTEDLVVFLDTPGHKAFSSMRERGALVTDLVVLVVAADDGVMEQTVESINFARKSEVQIIVAINKIDKVAKELSKRLEVLKHGLQSQGIVLEEDGGDVQSVRISALSGEGIHNLKEAILALAETLELKAYYDCNVECSVLESSIDPHRGRLATLLVKNGTLRRGDILLATNPIHGKVSWAKVRSMFNEYGQVLNEVTPGLPVQVIGWRDDTLPEAGDNVWQLSNEKQVKNVMQMARAYEQQVKKLIDVEIIQKKKEEHDKVYKAELAVLREAGIRYKRKNAQRIKQNLTEGDELKTSVVLKADVNGTLEVLLDIFDSFPNETCPVKLDLVHYGLGDVSENDIELASCFPNGQIYAFNTGVFSPSLFKLSKELGIPVRRFNVIYHLVDDLKKVIIEKMPYFEKEEVIGEAIVQQEFVISEKNKKAPVAGSLCIKGMLKKDALFKIVRKGTVLHDRLTLSSMRHHKDEVDTIKNSMDCGLLFTDNYITTSKYSGVDQCIRFMPQDILICYKLAKVKPQLLWSPKGL